MTSSGTVAGVREGDLLAGKYRIDVILGVGGMGVVVAAHHIHLDEKVAIKFLLPNMLDNADAVARFAREARAAVKIKSEHVARVSDVGMLENGAPYMVMEYLEGGDLAGWLQQRGALSIEQSVEFVLQASEAIAEAHALGIVHRDLKPANLFVIRRPDGPLSIKVLDFGISKMRGVGSSVPDVSITKTSTMMGSPLYMSPEQMQSSKDVDARTDIWALGVILYELLRGESPFLADTVPELVAKILSMPPPSLRAKRPDIPQGLEAVILRCLEKNRNRRYESIGEFAHALLPFAPRRSRLSIDRISGVMRAAGFTGSSTTPPSSSDPADTAPGAGTQGAFGRTSSPRKRTGLTVLAGMVVATIGVSGFYFSRRGAAPAGSPEITTASAEPAAGEVAKTSEPAKSLPPEPLPAPAVLPLPPQSALAPVVEPSAKAPAPIPTTPHAARPRVAQRPVVESVVAPVTAAPAPSPSPAPAPVQPKPAPQPVKQSSGAFDDRK